MNTIFIFARIIYYYGIKNLTVDVYIIILSETWNMPRWKSRLERDRDQNCGLSFGTLNNVQNLPKFLTL